MHAFSPAGDHPELRTGEGFAGINPEVGGAHQRVEGVAVCRAPCIQSLAAGQQHAKSRTEPVGTRHRDTLRLPVQNLPGSFQRVNRIGLAHTGSGFPSRRFQFRDGDTGLLQATGQPGAIGRSSLSSGKNVAVRVPLHPGDGPPNASCGRGERLRCLPDTGGRVEDGVSVSPGVRVHAHDVTIFFCNDGHCGSFLSGSRCRELAPACKGSFEAAL